MINSNDQFIYLHGGMNSEEIYQDFWILNLNTLSWLELDFKNKDEPYPCARAAHGGISINQNIIIR